MCGTFPPAPPPAVLIKGFHTQKKPKAVEAIDKKTAEVK